MKSCANMWYVQEADKPGWFDQYTCTNHCCKEHFPETDQTAKSETYLCKSIIHVIFVFVVHGLNGFTRANVTSSSTPQTRLMSYSYVPNNGVQNILF